MAPTWPLKCLSGPDSSTFEIPLSDLPPNSINIFPTSTLGHLDTPMSNIVSAYTNGTRSVLGMEQRIAINIKKLGNLARITEEDEALRKGMRCGGGGAVHLRGHRTRETS